MMLSSRAQVAARSSAPPKRPPLLSAFQAPARRRVTQRSEASAHQGYHAVARLVELRARGSVHAEAVGHRELEVFTRTSVAGATRGECGRRRRLRNAARGCVQCQRGRPVSVPSPPPRVSPLALTSLVHRTVGTHLPPAADPRARRLAVARRVGSAPGTPRVAFGSFGCSRGGAAARGGRPRPPRTSAPSGGAAPSSSIHAPSSNMRIAGRARRASRNAAARPVNALGTRARGGARVVGARSRLGREQPRARSARATRADRRRARRSPSSRGASVRRARVGARRRARRAPPSCARRRRAGVRGASPQRRAGAAPALGRLRRCRGTRAPRPPRTRPRRGASTFASRVKRPPAPASCAAPSNA